MITEPTTASITTHFAHTHNRNIGYYSIIFYPTIDLILIGNTINELSAIELHNKNEHMTCLCYRIVWLELLRHASNLCRRLMFLLAMYGVVLAERAGDHHRFAGIKRCLQVSTQERGTKM